MDEIEPRLQRGEHLPVRLRPGQLLLQRRPVLVHLHPAVRLHRPLMPHSHRIGDVFRIEAQHLFSHTAGCTETGTDGHATAVEIANTMARRPLLADSEALRASWQSGDRTPYAHHFMVSRTSAENVERSTGYL